MKEIHQFTIASRRIVGENFFRLDLQHGSQMQPVCPGQFVEVLVEGCPEVMLRRPISIHDASADGSGLSLLVQVVGKGTARLSSLQEGSRLNLVYPLGHGFSTDLPAGSRVLLVGGGAGVAPLFFLAKVLLSKGVEVRILLGGRRASLIPAVDDFSALAELCLTTDDGSLGHRGLVVEHPTFAEQYDMVYTCGPTPMMKAVARSAAERGLRCEVSLENMMACGLGACLCCVTPTDEGHRCVCKEGPVFDIRSMSRWYNS